jgi:hypothetical protein
MRLLNFCVLVLLVVAAAYVYQIKFEATLRAERVAQMRAEVRRERDAIAALRAEWATLENPARIQALVRRHLPLRPAEATQYDMLDQLPERAPMIMQPPPADATAAMIDNPDYEPPTGSIADQQGGPKTASPFAQNLTPR